MPDEAAPISTRRLTRRILAAGKANLNPRDISLLQLLLEDFETHDRNPFEAGVWAVMLHRLGNARMDIKPRLLRLPASLAYRICHLAVVWGFGIDLLYTVKLGRRVRLWHHGGMVLAASEIGDDVQLRHNTTLGIARIDDRDAKPTIAARVDVGAGAAIVGAVHVGHDSVVGANAVVTHDVPPFSVVAGVPARVIHTRKEMRRTA